MPQITLLERIDERLQAIWRSPAYASFCHRTYMAPHRITTGDLLFVGINPSFSEADLGIIYYDSTDSQLQYFRRFQNLAASVNLPWSHLDLLFFRETNQKHFDTIVKSKPGVKFIWAHLQIAKELLLDAKPSMIVVCNTLARKLLGKNKRGEWLGLDFQWDEQLGTYLLGTTPVFFTSMLSGQRALDRGSYERLAWHMRFVRAAQVGR